MEHVTVYRQPDRYAGWPANYGLWAWGNELVAGFTVGAPLADGPFHARDKNQPFVTMQARSLDGGHSWSPEPMHAPSPGGRALSSDEHMIAPLRLATALERGEAPQPTPLSTPLTFGPGLAILCARTGLGTGTRAWFYSSADRCRSWAGPHWLPRLGQAGIEARTDVVAGEGHTCTLMLTAARADGGEGKGVFCTRTVDGGRTWALRSWVLQTESGYAIMPSTVRLADGSWLTAVRRAEGSGDQRRNWIALYRSNDDALSWSAMEDPVPDTGVGGNPPALTLLQDGRLCLTYGYRNPPYGIRARLSADRGVSWSPEIILRKDGGSHDLGYPRTIQRPDGTLVTVYYFNDRPGGAAYIAATLWRAEEYEV
ncbi:MAG: sialidase family protein [Anaerolineae bacterium]|jgi:hypothetical protein|nr:exo-alpha-sialidase [Chloroflexota bacterium]